MGTNYYILLPSCISRSKKRLWDKHNIWVHVGRRTGTNFIWNIHPDELEEYELAGCVPYHEHLSPVPWETIKEFRSVEYTQFMHHVGKNQVFC